MRALELRFSYLKLYCRSINQWSRTILYLYCIRNNAGFTFNYSNFRLAAFARKYFTRICGALQSNLISGTETLSFLFSLIRYSLLSLLSTLQISFPWFHAHAYDSCSRSPLHVSWSMRCIALSRQLYLTVSGWANCWIIPRMPNPYCFIPLRGMIR